MRRKWYFIAPAAILAMVAFIFIGGEVVKLLWNWLVPSIVGWRAITFWEAVGLLALCRILFGGFGRHGGGPGRGGLRERMADRMADRVGDRWQKMTPEERERFRQRILDRCGFDPTVRQTPAP